jgi:hypothetical protein
MAQKIDRIVRASQAQEVILVVEFLRHKFYLLRHCFGKNRIY